ncbi:CHRD domain-containing protein [Pseudoflavitalea sp. X16]|uniref:CHRD domain-containing protein n=1 Tax=Paraflavitalea devenefica TaxID=2716334 RepID=UPI001422C71A|nr:CHRD domain-containing protein [Paraflavitalea devenefica]NII26823.1 CHRD domain-containing protein [Paraflavitalea devenefica]
MRQYYMKTRVVCTAMLLMVSIIAHAAIHPFLATYSGSQENPPNPSPAIGTIAGVYNDATNTLHYTIAFGGLLAGTTAAHFHAPAAPGVNAPVVIAHAGFPVGVTAGTYAATEVLTDEQETQLMAGLWYSNIHTTLLPGGEIRAQIVLGIPNTLHFFIDEYSGSQEVPPNNSPGRGLIFGVYDAAGNRIYYGIVFGGLMTNTTAAHFHAPGAPGVSAPVIIAHAGFPVGVQAGWYANTHLLTDEQETQLLDGLWYSNIHTTGLPGGEIRAQIMPKEQADSSCTTIANLHTDPCLLWPPNHKMRDVKVHYTAGDNCPDFGGCELSVTSNEAVNGSGDGNTSPDWEVIDDHHVRLRAERSGNGNGRVYTIKVTCRDPLGDTFSRSTTVIVPHDRRDGNGVDCPQGRRESGLSAIISNNPGRGNFMLNIQTDNRTDRIQITISSMSGRIVSNISNIIGSQVVRIGDNLDAGVYFVKIIQGDQTIQLKLIKVN